MKSVSLIITGTFLLTCSLLVRATDVVTIVNVANGYSPFAYHDKVDEYLGGNTVEAITRASKQERANWEIVYHQDDTVSFKNKKVGYCIDFYGKDDKAVQNVCDYNNPNQRVYLTKKGSAKIISFKSNGLCLATVDDYIRATDCEHNNPHYHWLLNSPI